MNIERLDHNMVKLTIEASAEDFEKAMQQAYLKNKNRIQIQGFRKGKAPRVMIEKMYGPEVFYEDAANALIPDAYAAALETEECKALDIVSQPEIDVVQIEKGKEFIFTAEVAVRPEVTLGEYMNLGIEKRLPKSATRKSSRNSRRPASRMPVPLRWRTVRRKSAISR